MSGRKKKKLFPGFRTRNLLNTKLMSYPNTTSTIESYFLLSSSYVTSRYIIQEKSHYKNSSGFEPLTFSLQRRCFTSRLPPTVHVTQIFNL
jgi:hypothetical protein